MIYPKHTLGIELTFLFLYTFIQYVRLFLGLKGNKTESASNMLWFLLLSAGILFGQIFFIRLQTYVYFPNIHSG